LERRAKAEENAIREVLGEDRFAAWTRYVQASSERAQINHFSSQLAAAGEPMNIAVVDQLVDSMFEENQASDRELRDYRQSLGESESSVMSRDSRRQWLSSQRAAHGRVHDAMAASLTPLQLAQLDAMLAARLLPVEAQLRLDKGN
jgi:hypothetical protein